MQLGGKYMRTFEGSKRPFEPFKPKKEVPPMSSVTLRVVFNSHVIG